MGIQSAYSTIYGMETQRATRKQQELLQFVDGFIREHGYGPSYREIMSGLGYKSVSTVAIHIDGLITKGYLSRRDNSARSLEVVTMSSTSTASKDDTTSTVVKEVTNILKKSTEKSDRDVLLRALELLGYSEASVQLRSKYETEASATD